MEQVKRHVPLHEDNEVCRYLLNGITHNGICIQESQTPGAGSGLFTTRGFAEGECIFRTRPLTSFIQSGLSSVCDLCFSNKASKIDPSGRFRTSKTPPQNTVPSCSGCKVTRYCSEACCHESALCHRYECEIFSKCTNLGIKEGLLYRIIVQREHGLISDQQWRALWKLMSHHTDHLQGPDFESITQIAKEAKTLTGSSLELLDIQKLHCLLRTNCISIRQPGQNVVLGTTLDVVASLMNHSCNPNVVLFFEGNELRVQSLRPLQANEELTQCYTDVQCDVLLRQKLLEENYFFTCCCARCREELDYHQKRELGNNSHIEVVRQTQQQLLNLVNNTVAKASTNIESVNVDEVATTAETLADETAVDGNWPDDLEPLPSLWKTLGRISQAQGNALTGLEYSLEGCASTKRRIGPRWMDDLFELIQVFTHVLVLPEDDSVFQDESFPRKSELSILFYGYLEELFRLGRNIYGLDTCYVQAIKNWLKELRGSSEQPWNGRLASNERFSESHGKLLEWIGVDRGKWIVGC
ncbi:hypothetical protein F5B20DRAFT_536023 [Whalleya microplaca]|nr:hypothetical protein F5B20DRAFT_536023 [Whalleya microplaca]